MASSDWSNARVRERGYVSNATTEEGGGHYVVMATPPNGKGIHRRPIKAFDSREEAQAYATAQNKFWIARKGGHIVHCPHCGTQPDAQLTRYPRRWTQILCRKCGLAFLNPKLFGPS